MCWAILTSYLLTVLFIIAANSRRVASFALGHSFGNVEPQPKPLRWLVWLYLPLAFLVIRDVLFFYRAA